VSTILLHQHPKNQTHLIFPTVFRLRHLAENDLAEEWSGQFEGDIIISPEQRNELLIRAPKTGLIDAKYRWTDNTVPYQIKVEDFGECRRQFS
jgi:hypothetical protein